ncbi:MAG: hypothetical protein H6Q33_1418 [Deltaproteobacteria bacterium]|nr:hypothetical protein [Deltaproteobacteria bacterium]
MTRRDLQTTLGVASVAAGLPDETAFGGGGSGPGPSGESRKAYQDLLAVLHELDSRFLSPEWKVDRPADIVLGHRYLMHLLSYALDVVFEADLERPGFRRIVGPQRKFMGDNPDAIYYFAYIRPDRSYRVRGNTAGAVYTSFTLEQGTRDGHWPKGVALSINVDDLKVAPDGSYELILGPGKRPGNWYKIDPEVGSVTTRHYFEQERPAAGDRTKVIPLSIEPLDPVGPRPAPDDASVAAGLRRVINFMRSTTIDMPPFLQPGQVPTWVSTVPNQFNPAAKPGSSIGASFQDAAYAMAPYALKPDEALVIEGRFPKCRFANVNLWTRFQQTFDYTTRTVSLNRRQTKLEPDGSFRMVVAHADPGVSNWLDTEGQPGGIVFWRFVLPEDPIAPLRTEVVPLSKVRKP